MARLCASDIAIISETVLKIKSKHKNAFAGVLFFQKLLLYFFNHAVGADAFAAAIFHRVGIHHFGFGVIILRHSRRTVHGANKASQTFVFVHLVFCHIFIILQLKLHRHSTNFKN
jgi:hypothetical protein